MRNRTARLLSALALAAALLPASEAAMAQSKHRWKMQAAFPGAMVHFGPVGAHFVEAVKLATGGSVEIRMFEPGALVPALQVLDAVSVGSVDAGYASASFWVGKLPQAALFAGPPFGPNATTLLAWLKHGGGIELYDKMYAPMKVKSLPCSAFSPEGAGWFRREIDSVDDLKGMKMRIAGLGGNVLERFGVSTQLLAAGDIYPALELGAIDATEFSMPAIDLGVGFHQVAKYYYLPGWHQQAGLHEFMFNMEKWNALSEQQRAQIALACDATLAHGLAAAEAVNATSLAELEKRGAEVRVLSDDVLRQLEAAWLEVARKEAEKSPEFKEVLASFTEFRTRYEAWADKAYLK